MPTRRKEGKEGQPGPSTAVPGRQREGRASQGGGAPAGLAAQAEAGDELLVAGEIGVAQVIQQAPALADHDDQAPARVVVGLVALKVPGQVLNPLGEEGHLNLHGTAILFVLLIFLLVWAVRNLTFCFPELTQKAQ